MNLSNRFATLVKFFLGISLVAIVSVAHAFTPPPEKQDIIIVGDRAADLAIHLGVMPVAMSIRASSWPEAAKLKNASQMLGCPNFVTTKKKETIPNAIKKFGVKHLIVEKSAQFCLMKKKVKPENVLSLVEGLDITVDVIDFSDGVEDAIDQMGKVLKKEEKAAELKASYAKKMAKAEAFVNKNKARASGKKVVVLNGVVMKGKGKGFLRVEAPGFYSDSLFLDAIGMENVSSILIGDKEIDKGHLTIRKLDKLVEAQPDIIILTGDSLPFQQALAKGLKKNPALAKVPAIRDYEIYTLPASIGSSVITYPDTLTTWAKTLTKL
ncbi:ABC transporter substrate-binding protein [Vibrio sp. JC009]|uniref:ABC transporter substrate-binding protein n=1 Tax=Vibrio sp. JC009 TaxID=2912314 RepID=UPI0023AFC429|nr:ABC transporter substrate-binding protein [Vibrio sp. JC009]WED24668.1 ABC transporter substrate-binding protein [Vibrio sp. JC009]